MGGSLITIGLIIVTLGVLLSFAERAGLPRLPGDLFIQRGHFTFYVPFATMLLMSMILTIIINLFRGK